MTREFDGTDLDLVLERKGLSEDAPCIYLVDSPDHAANIETADLVGSSVVRVFVRDWDTWLTPWPAPGLSMGGGHGGDSDNADGNDSEGNPHKRMFAGSAPEFLAALKDRIFLFESSQGLSPRGRGIAGYSLAGLFSIYAFVDSGCSTTGGKACCLGADACGSGSDSGQSIKFDAAASGSGSFWYDGWIDYLMGFAESLSTFASSEPRDLPYVYFSLGNRERKTRDPRMSTIEDMTSQTMDILESCGMRTSFEMHHGGHFEKVGRRVRLAVEALDRALYGIAGE